MIIREPRPKSNFTTFSNDLIEDKALSFKARGLLHYLLSKPDNWTVRESELVKSSDKDGQSSIRSGLQELMDAGYIARKRVRQRDGTFQWVSTIYDNPRVDSSRVDNRPLISTEEVSTDKQVLNNSSVFSQSDSSSLENDPLINDLPSTATPTKQPKKAKPSVKSEVHPNTQPILQAYLEVLDYTPSSFPQEARAAKEIAQAGHTPGDVAAAYTLLKSEPFWASKHLSLANVHKQMPALQQAHSNGKSKPEKGLNGYFNMLEGMGINPWQTK